MVRPEKYVFSVSTLARCSACKLNNLQLQAGGLVLRTESPETGHRPVVRTPCESGRAARARRDVPPRLAPSLRSSEQRGPSKRLGPRRGAPVALLQHGAGRAQLPRGASLEPAPDGARSHVRRGGDADGPLRLASPPGRLLISQRAQVCRPLSRPRGAPAPVSPVERSWVPHTKCDAMV